MLAHGERLVLSIRELLLGMQAETARPVSAQEAFCDYYPFVVEYVGKILSASERGDALAAGAAAYALQEELSQVLCTIQPGLQVTEFNLLGEYSAAYREAGFPDLLATASRGDLALLADEARKLGVMVAAWLTERGVETNILADGEELQRFLARRVERE